MARIDYWAIEQALKDTLEANLNGVSVRVEEEMIFGAEATPWVGVYLERRESPDALQTLCAGQRVRYRMTFSVWCWAYALEMAVAMRERDDLLGKLELILMANREWHEQIEMSWIGGGELPSARLEQNAAFVCGGEITVIADASAIID